MRPSGTGWPGAELQASWELDEKTMAEMREYLVSLGDILGEMVAGLHYGLRPDAAKVHRIQQALRSHSEALGYTATFTGLGMPRGNGR